MAKKTKLIAMCAVTVGADARFVEPGSTFETDAAEAEWFIAQGAARTPAPEAERLAAEEAGGGAGQGTLT